MGGAQRAEKVVTFAGGYETRDGGSFQIEFRGPVTDAQPVREFLEPQLRDASVRNLVFSVNYFCRLTTIIFAGSARRGSRSRSAASGESSWTAGTPPSRPGRKAHNCHPSRGAGGVSPEGP